MPSYSRASTSSVPYCISPVPSSAVGAMCLTKKKTRKTVQRLNCTEVTKFNSLISAFWWFVKIEKK